MQTLGLGSLGLVRDCVAIGEAVINKELVSCSLISASSFVIDQVPFLAPSLSTPPTFQDATAWYGVESVPKFTFLK